MVATVIQYVCKTATYSERYGTFTVRYTIFNPQHGKKICALYFFTAKFEPCTFLPLLVRQYVDTKIKAYNYFGKYRTTISELF